MQNQRQRLLALIFFVESAERTTGLLNAIPYHSLFHLLDRSPIVLAQVGRRLSGSFSTGTGQATLADSWGELSSSAILLAGCGRLNR
jgi:hypothetical protein